MISTLKGRFVHVNNRTISYTDEGSGQPLILVHGWGFDRSSWQPTIDRLVTKYRVIAIDLRGHGRSQSSTESYSMKDLSTDLFELLMRLNLPEAPVLAGHSLGGSIVLQFAADHPTVAKALIVMDTELNSSPTIRLAMMATTTIFSWAMRLASFVLGARRSLKLYPSLLNLAAYSESWQKKHPELVKEASNKFITNNNVDDLIWSLAAFASRSDLTKDLAQFSSPVLFMRGSKDLIINQASMEALQQAIPRSLLRVIQDSGHTIISEQPDTVVAMMDAFLHESLVECTSVASHTTLGGFHQRSIRDEIRSYQPLASSYN